MNNSIKKYIKALRAYQWSKNIIIFLPLLASHKFSHNLFYDTFVAFISFSLISSSVYIINDILDVKNDTAHPVKKNRPFASGDILILNGLIFAGVCFFLGFLVALYVNKNFMIIVLSYFILSNIYSYLLKSFAILDLVLLSSFYLIRILSGGIATETIISFWLLIFSFLIFFSLASVKRLSEINYLSSKSIDLKGRGYVNSDLPLITGISLSSGYLSILVLALYINSETSIALYKSPQLLLLCCCILFYWISRLIFLGHRNKINIDPILFALKDKVSWLCLLLLGILVFVSLKF